MAGDGQRHALYAGVAGFGAVDFGGHQKPVCCQSGGAVGEFHALDDAVGLYVRPAQCARGHQYHRPSAARHVFYGIDQNAVSGGRPLADDSQKRRDIGRLCGAAAGPGGARYPQTPGLRSNDVATPA